MLIKTLIKNFCKNDSGQVAVSTAVAAVPLLLSVSVALDSDKTNRARIQLQAALDNAVLAAVSNQTLTTDERKLYATERF